MNITLSHLFAKLGFIDSRDSVAIVRDKETVYEGRFIDIPYKLYAESPVTAFDFANGEDADTTYIAYIE